MNDYKKIQRDFSFLTLYGYNFEHIEHHYIMPSVVFSNTSQRIQIGMNYEDGDIFILYYENLETFRWKNLLDDIHFSSNKYEEQVEKAKDILIKFLTNKTKSI